MPARGVGHTTAPSAHGAALHLVEQALAAGRRNHGLGTDLARRLGITERTGQRLSTARTAGNRTIDTNEPDHRIPTDRKSGGNVTSIQPGSAGQCGGEGVSVEQDHGPSR
jgi:hypothetical protein